MKINRNMWMRIGGVSLVLLLCVGIFYVFHHFSKTQLSAIPFFSYEVSDKDVRIDGKVLELKFPTKRAIVGYNGEIAMICNDNKISLLTIYENTLLDTPTKHKVECCTFGDCTKQWGTDWGCVIDWQNQKSICVASSSMRCVSDVGCPGGGNWVPDWSNSMAKRFYCKFGEEGDLGFCTVREETPFECWENEGCPDGIECIDNFCKYELKW